MNVSRSADLNLFSWNILAPALVIPEWYPTEYHLAAKFEERINKIIATISSLTHDIVLIQEAQESTILLLKQKLENEYKFYFSPNNPSETSIATGLLTLIRRDWKYASNSIVIDGILDSVKGEAIQILTIPSKNIHIVNLHLNYMDPLIQAKMVLAKCEQLLNSTSPITILAGDMNAETYITDQFGWNDFEDVFHQSKENVKIPTYYPDPSYSLPNTAIDHIFYDSRKIKLIDYGKAWTVSNESLNVVLTRFGSDHIFVWSSFSFFQ